MGILSHGLEAVTKQLPICDRWMKILLRACLCCKAAPRKTKFKPKSLAPSTWILWGHLDPAGFFLNDCVYDVCHGAGEVAAELAAELLTSASVEAPDRPQ